MQEPLFWYILMDEFQHLIQNLNQLHSSSLNKTGTADLQGFTS